MPHGVRLVADEDPQELPGIHQARAGVENANYKIHGAQATGCSPISAAQKAGLDFFKPVKPNTIAKSLAIGTPADGFYALRMMKETGGAAEDVTDDEIREGIKCWRNAKAFSPKPPAASRSASPRN